MNKNKILFKYAMFYLYGQYKSEKNIGAYIFLLLFQAGSWLCVAWFLYSQISNGLLAIHSAFVVPVCINVLFAITEKSGELSIGYNLKKYFNIKKSDIIKLRLVCRLLNVGEYFFVAVIVFLSAAFMPKAFVVAAALLTWVVDSLLYEVIACFSYKYEDFTGPIKPLTILLAMPLIWELLPLVCEILEIGTEFIYYAQSAIYVVSAVLAVWVVVTAVFPQHRRRRTTVTTKISAKVQTDENKPTNTTWVLIKKDLIYIFSQKMSLWVNPIFLIVLFYLLDGIEVTSYMLPSWFIVEFTSTYGLNYFGHDKEAFVNIILSSAPRHKIIRAKNLVILFVNTFFTCLIYGAGLVIGAVELENTMKYFTVAIMAIGMSMLISPYFSIKNYHNPEKDTFKDSLWPVFIFATFEILFFVIYYYPVNPLITLLVGAVFLMAALIRNCINPKGLGRKLEQNERILLNKYLG